MNPEVQSRFDAFEQRSADLFKTAFVQVSAQCASNADVKVAAKRTQMGFLPAGAAELAAEEEQPAAAQVNGHVNGKINGHVNGNGGRAVSESRHTSDSRMLRSRMTQALKSEKLRAALEDGATFEQGLQKALCEASLVGGEHCKLCSDRSRCAKGPRP